MLHFEGTLPKYVFIFIVFISLILIFDIKSYYIVQVAYTRSTSFLSLLVMRLKACTIRLGFYHFDLRVECNTNPDTTFNLVNLKQHLSSSVTVLYLGWENKEPNCYKYSHWHWKIYFCIPSIQHWFNDYWLNKSINILFCGG